LDKERILRSGIIAADDKALSQFCGFTTQRQASIFHKRTEASILRNALLGAFKARKSLD
jgi:hypothetical protein